MIEQADAALEIEHVSSSESDSDNENNDESSSVSSGEEFF